MIQTRYQYYGPNGIAWTDWRDLEPDDTQLEKLQTEQKWQVKDKLLNEFRVI